MKAPAPWDGVPSQDQLFVLVTGANSGIGLGIAQQLVDVFLTQRSPSAHLVLVVTTRSQAKSRATLEAVRGHLRGRGGGSSAAARIHLVGVELDLCRLPTVYAAAEQLIHGGVDVFTAHNSGSLANETPTRACLPRLDVAIFNAGIGGWTGFSIGGMMVQLATAGLLQSLTFPSYKLALAGQLVDPLTGKRANGESSDSLLGEVFCANVFGHYLLAHALLPLLRRPSGTDDGLPAARIVWESSVEAYCWDALAVEDLQGVRTTAAYESSKRLTDVLALTSGLPGVRRLSGQFLGEGEKENENEIETNSTSNNLPRQYVTHPGVVCSSLFPLPQLLFYLYYIAMYIARWAGSPWHPVTAYNGATAAVWVALQPADALEAAQADKVKWGACVTRSGRAVVKRTEVEGWGWQGDVDSSDSRDKGDNSTIIGYLRNSVGRRAGATTLTAERRQDFEALGRTCWQEMERLRRVWEDKLACSRQKGH
ncbi:3-ketosteroid reductase [Grosmannia clavigera kw1407]|uniref:3-ketosteroid reductase n=1 Tax=Grosmannia clavigera (strain kw1407 / UAMH 11150) TaxID=655863 RepID=F0XLE9_GROCL|nr:3-ketosteroid reductase [Grosmannia clavigera kw1407]EFX01136.1 3-ketosteroid reductase [Grosmannia clavigera kw1407]